MWTRHRVKNKQGPSRKGKVESYKEKAERKEKEKRKELKLKLKRGAPKLFIKGEHQIQNWNRTLELERELEREKKWERILVSLFGIGKLVFIEINKFHRCVASKDVHYNQ